VIPLRRHIATTWSPVVHGEGDFTTLEDLGQESLLYEVVGTVVVVGLI